MRITNPQSILSVLSIAGLLASGCRASDPEGLAVAARAQTTIKMDFYDRPLPTIPLPNDVATRFDATSATMRRVNASMIAPTGLERRVRELIDGLDGWGLFQPISVPFTGPIDVQSILDAHRDRNYDLADDVIYLVNVTPDSPKFKKVYHLDVGNGNYPVVLEKSHYWDHDPRGWTISLAYEEADEDTNGNGMLDEGEDTDADGLLDKPNYLPGHNPARDDLAGRADALMTFYEKQNHTLIVRPMIPLDERTTYAVVVTRRILDEDGQPIGSPFKYINHTAQTKALEPLREIMPDLGITFDDVAFTFSFTTQTVESNWVAVRDGLYGKGVQAHIGKEFPPDIDAVAPVRDIEVFRDIENPHLMYTENWINRFREVYDDVFGANTDGLEFEALEEAHNYIDFHVVGSFMSPQLFERTDEDGKWLPNHDQVWPEDLDRIPAKTRAERVHFWLTVPRKEVSDRGKGKPAPVVILGHGYTSSRLELLPFAGFFAKHGFATLSIDCVSHGVGIDELTKAAAIGIFEDAGLGPFVHAALEDRAHDMNNNFKPDSGADFWTAYLFHTRDAVRQSALDYMQLIRILDTWDGTKRWKLDLNGDGTNEIAGDFDGDDEVDIGLDSLIGMTGGSLGGIMTLVVGGLEPSVDVAVPIAGGGGLSDIGVRSGQGGVREAVVLRMMAPVYLGGPDPDYEGMTRVQTLVPDLNDDVTRNIWRRVPGVKPGDTVVGFNMVNSERGCAYITEQGTFRFGVASDKFDPTVIKFYKGSALVLGNEDCALKDGVEAYYTVDKWERDIDYQGEYHFEGDPLISLEEGYGLRRANPETRRFMGIAQLIMDPSDPAVLGRHMLEDRITYSDGKTTGTHAMVVTTAGDMNVPASSGLTLARATGLLNYLDDDPVFGKPKNQVLIDTYHAEAVNTFKRFTDPQGNGVHIDVELFSRGLDGKPTDMWGEGNPRLSSPVRSATDLTDALGGTSGAIFPFTKPDGEHGFAFPGALTDKAIASCKRACTQTGGEDPCNCAALEGETFDIGFFMFNMFGRYFRSAGTAVDFDLCNSRDDCSDIPPVPVQREISTLH